MMTSSVSDGPPLNGDLDDAAPEEVDSAAKLDDTLVQGDGDDAVSDFQQAAHTMMESLMKQARHNVMTVALPPSRWHYLNRSSQVPLAVDYRELLCSMLADEQFPCRSFASL
jgi:hypothetical protein